jgi:hypothetical protein
MHLLKLAADYSTGKLAISHQYEKKNIYLIGYVFHVDRRVLDEEISKAYNTS